MEKVKKKKSSSGKKDQMVDLKKLFKFKSFSERIASIHIDVTRQVKAPAQNPEDQVSFFNEGLGKWRELNCTLDFLEFVRGVQGRAGSLAQIVFHKEDIITHLIKCLEKKDTLAFEPVLDLVVQLARDLQEEFYPHFRRFFPVLVNMCSTTNVDQIQCVFNTFAYLFKFLWRHMIKDLRKVFTLYSELLSLAQKPHIRQFAAESFGFLLRKVKKQEKLVAMISSSLGARPEICVGVAQLLFEVCRGVEHQFHSCTLTFMPLLLDTMGQCAITEDSSPDCHSPVPASSGSHDHVLGPTPSESHDQVVFQCLCKMVELMVDHTRREHAEPLWTPLLNHLSACIDRCRDTASSEDLSNEEELGRLSRSLGHALHLVGIATAWKKGSRIQDLSGFMEMLKLVLEMPHLPGHALNITLHLTASLTLNNCSSQDAVEANLDLVKVITQRWVSASVVEEVEVVLTFYQELLTGQGDAFVQMVLPYCLQYCEGVAREETVLPSVLGFLCELCLREDHTSMDDSSTVVPRHPTQTFQLDFTAAMEKTGVPLPATCRQQTPRRSRRLRAKVPETLGRVFQALDEKLGKGLSFLRGKEEGGHGKVREGLESEMEWLWCALVCVRHCRPVQAQLFSRLKEIFELLVVILLDEGDDRRKHTLYHILYGQSLSALVGVADELDEDSGGVAPLADVPTVLKHFPRSLPVLASSLQYLSLLASPDPVRPRPSPISPAMLEQLMPVLSANLSSPLHPVRWLTLQILCQLEQPLVEGTQDKVGYVPDVLEACLNAEEVAPDLDSYRGKLLWLQKLKYRPGQETSLPEVHREVALRYLVGVLAVNFSLLWEPVCEIIRSHAVEENKLVFWKVYGELLAQASSTVTPTDLEGNCDIDHQSEVESRPHGRDWHTSLSSLFRQQNGIFSGSRCRRPDHVTHRVLLWKVLAGSGGGGVSPVVESRSRILVPLFLQFIEKEYSLREDSLMETQDISSCSSRTLSSDDSATLSAGKKNLTKTLVTMLKVFTNFQNPKSMYRKDDLWTLYMKLLVHNWTEVQTLALAGLLTFKPPYLVPYKENFERLLDEKSLKEELINFRFDAECVVVANDHKDKLLPVLIRLLYGLMLKKVGGGSGSKGGGVARKGLVLRFLGGCEGSELEEFISLLTTPFKSISSQTDESGDPACVVPLRRQQGFLNMVGQMTADLGPKLLPHLQQILQIMIYLRRSCTQLLDQREKIEPHFIGAVKNLRQLATNKLTQLFGKFSGFDFSSYHDQILRAFVWPQLDQLPAQNLQSPTPLLKLLGMWASQPRYWCLLSKPLPSSATPPTTLGSPSEAEPVSILKYVLDCLHLPKVSRKICSFVMEMSVHLLSSDREACGGEELKLETEQPVSGEELVRPFIPGLLDYLNRAISDCCYKGKLRNTNSRGNSLHSEFVVLSSISSFVNCPEQSAILMKLLLPFLHHGEQFKEQEGVILLALSNLVVKTDSAGQHSRSLAQLFQIVKDRSSRNTLCEIFQRLASKDSQWNKTADIVSKLNAWDRRLVEEPDYDLRLEGYLEAKEMLAAIHPDRNNWTTTRVDLVFPILHNALFSLLESSDMSLRDASASFVSQLITNISIEDKEAFHHIILSSTVAAAKLGLRSKQDHAQREFVSVLSQLVKMYSDHQRFRDLYPLSHHDPDADFFLNVNHIQLHRRTRAFRKLATLCASGSVGQSSCLDFVLPLANHVIFSSTSSTEQNLLAEAVGVIGAVCSHLTWTHYSFLLRHYLRLLPKKVENQKNLIKVVIAVLDNFHFDLSSVTSILETETAKTSTQQSRLPPRERAMEEDISNGREEENCKMDVDVPDSDKTKEEEQKEEEGTEGKTLALKIYRTVTGIILPSLQQVLTRKMELPGHKLSHQMGYSETYSDILRVPVAMAMTKLLLVLPEEQLHSQLPNVLLKVCNTLKHRSRDVRDVGRSTLVKMATSLGPRYLQYILKEMKAALTRGYMLHVLSYSLHYLLHAMATPTSSSSSQSSSSSLVPGDLDPSFSLVSEILKEDLFGAPAEERESGEGVAKIPESKSPQSYNTYEIVARYLSPGLVPKLLAPIKEVLEVQPTSRTCRVVEEVFRRVASGIQQSSAFTSQALLVFIHGVLSNSVPLLAQKQKPKSVGPVSLRPPDSRLLPPAPGRSGPKPVAAKNTSSSIVTEFGLQLLHSSLKHSKFDCSDKEQLQMLDPFVGLIAATLANSAHSKVLCRTLHCLIWLLRLPLGSIPQHLDSIVENIFRLIRRHARMGMAVGANKELVLSSFKAMTVVVRELKCHVISEDELRILLGFVDEDIQDYQRQSTAFPLLKAILGRKLVVNDIYELMTKVSSLSLTSDSEHVRLQSRQAVLQFILDYPLGKKLINYLDFFLTNLGYEEQSGRESMLEQLNSIFNKFPEKLLNEYSSYFFVPVSLRLVNEEAPTCKKMAAATLVTLMKRLNPTKMREIVDIAETWICDLLLLHRRLGMLALGVIVETEGRGFEKRLSTFLPHITSCLDQQLLESLADLNKKEEEEKDDDGEEEERKKAKVGRGIQEGEKLEEEVEDEGLLEERRTEDVDRLLFSTLNSLSKILQHCDVVALSEHTSRMCSIWACVHKLMLHPHSWVRLLSSRLVGLLLAGHSPEELVQVCLEGKGQEEGETEPSPLGKKRKRKKVTAKESASEQYLHQDTLHKVQDLCRISCFQFSSPLLSPDLADQVTKNLVFLGKVLHRYETDSDSFTDDQATATGGGGAVDLLQSPQEPGGRGETKVEEEEKKKKDFKWLVSRLTRLARFEAGHHPKESIKRVHIFHWTAAMSHDLGASHLLPHLTSLLRPLHGELSDSSHRAGPELHALANEVIDLIKEVCGKDTFARAYAGVQKLAVETREKRKKEAVMEAVMDPEKSMLRKRRKNELKKESKRRKMFSLRPDGTAAAKSRRHH